MNRIQRGPGANTATRGQAANANVGPILVHQTWTNLEKNIRSAPKRAQCKSIPTCRNRIVKLQMSEPMRIKW